MLSDLVHIMPITASVASKLDASVFANSIVVHINNLLDDFLILNELLLHLGADLIFVPKSYGNRELPPDLPYDSFYARVEDAEFAIYKNLERIAEAPNELEPAVQAAIIEAFANRVSTSDRRVLILEDGGYHYNVLPAIETHLPPSSPGIVAGVEQTTRGIVLAEKYRRNSGKLNHPILTVARSKLKTRYENRFIAQRVLEELSLLLYSLNEFLSYRDVLLMGYGILGRAIAMTARKMDCRVFIKDIDPEIERAAMREGFRVVKSIFPELFETLPIVLGVTGDASFTLPMFEQFLQSSAPRLYLVSASSGRVEFSSVIHFFEGTPEERYSLAEELQSPHLIENISVRRIKAGFVYSFSYRDNTREVVLLAACRKDFFPYNSDLW